MDVTKDNPFKIFLQYAIPAVFGMLAISSASIIDGLFVGNYVGAVGLAAINMSIPIFSLMFGLSLMLSIGSSVITGKLMAEGDTKSASLMFTKTLITMLCLSLFITVLLYFNMQTILIWFGATPELVILSTEYLSYILFFIPFLMNGIVLDYFVKIDSRPTLAFGALLFSALINIIFDWLLIVEFEQGIIGAALATGLSQIGLVAVLLPHFFSKKSTIFFVKPSGSWISIIKSGVNGASEFINEMSIGITTIIFNYIMIQTFGVDGVAAYTVVNYIIWVSVMVSFGVSDSLPPIISKNFGAKEPKRIRAFLKYAFSSVFLVGILLSIITVTIPEIIIDIFLEQKDQATIDIVAIFLSFIWMTFLFNGSNMVISAYFTAMHKPINSGIIAILRSLIFPILFVFILPLLLGNKGIYLAIPVSEFFTFIVAVYLLTINTPQKIMQEKYI